MLLTAWYGCPKLKALQMLIKHEVAMYIVARMILGFGIVFCIVSGSAILGELVSLLFL